MHSIIDAEIIIRNVLKKAGIKYFNNENYFDEFNITFGVKGQCAGQAGYKTVWGERTYYMRFNKEALTTDPNHFINNTIPHEIAHIICYIRPELGKNHNAGWRNICVALGGSGERCHNIKLTPGRKTRKFLYKATCGTIITLSSIRHNKIQKGATYTLCRTNGKLNSNCKYKQVA